MRTCGYREGSTKHWGLLRGKGEGQQVGGSWGKIAWGEMPDIDEGEEGSKSQSGVYLCKYLACSSHVPQNLKCNLKKKSCVGFLFPPDISNTKRGQKRVGFRIGLGRKICPIGKYL